MSKPEKLMSGEFYHIYHRGNNRENIFIEEKNYTYFLDLWEKYILPIADTWVYCLMRNHFHAMVRIHCGQTSEVLETSEVFKAASGQTSEVLETSEVFKAAKVLKTSGILKPDYISKQFSNLFNAYAKAVNKKYNRTGSLFQTRFGRKRVTNGRHLINLIHYIHRNPQHHNFVDDFREYPYSSWHSLLSTKKTHLVRDDVLEIFQGKSAMKKFHVLMNDYKTIQYLIVEDDL